jgi:putative Mn2+ efflux pump MntP
MRFPLILAIALALAMDAFAVSVGLSLSREGLTEKQTSRIAIYFGFFQFMMTVIGWLAGQSVLRYIQAVDHWIAFVLLSFIGGKMIYESFSSQKRLERKDSDPTKGLSLLMLSVATSIDALAVGLSLAFIHVNILYPAAVIGAVTFLLTIAGVKTSGLLGQWLGKRAGLLGGLILILIGIKILYEHL